MAFFKALSQVAFGDGEDEEETDINRKIMRHQAEIRQNQRVIQRDAVKVEQREKAATKRLKARSRDSKTRQSTLYSLAREIHRQQREVARLEKAADQLQCIFDDLARSRTQHMLTTSIRHTTEIMKDVNRDLRRSGVRSPLTEFERQREYGKHLRDNMDDVLDEVLDADDDMSVDEDETCVLNILHTNGVDPRRFRKDGEDSQYVPPPPTPPTPSSSPSTGAHRTAAPQAVAVAASSQLEHEPRRSTSGRSYDHQRKQSTGSDRIIEDFDDRVDRTLYTRWKNLKK